MHPAGCSAWICGAERTQIPIRPKQKNDENFGTNVLNHPERSCLQLPRIRQSTVYRAFGRWEQRYLFSLIFSGVVAEITDWRNAGWLIVPDDVRLWSPSRPIQRLHPLSSGGSEIRPYQQPSSHIRLAKHTQATPLPTGLRPSANGPWRAAVAAVNQHLFTAPTERAPSRVSSTLVRTAWRVHGLAFEVRDSPVFCLLS